MTYRLHSNLFFVFIITNLSLNSNIEHIHYSDLTLSNRYTVYTLSYTTKTYYKLKFE